MTLTRPHLPRRSMCPICETVYGDPPWTVEECGGDGRCPAREAGPRPTEQHVLCACNRRWLETPSSSIEGHGFDDCGA